MSGELTGIFAAMGLHGRKSFGGCLDGWCGGKGDYCASGDGCRVSG